VLFRSGDDLDSEAVVSGVTRLAFALSMAFSTLSSLNFGLMVFNLLPSFPLDGGKALAEFLSARFDLAFATQVVAILGFGVVAWCLYRAFASQGIWMLMIGWSLYEANRQALKTLGRRKWSRWS
jgi:Zn-dependent protease